jgi:ribosomal protein S18 acetylase RimI-like enzyme
MAQTSDVMRIVRPYKRADLRATCAMMARAFADDPLMAWIFPDEHMRRRRLPAFFATSMRTAGQGENGTELVVASDVVLGCAIWLRPGAWVPSAWQQLAALPGYVRTLGSRLSVASVSYAALAAAHPHEPHWYLAGIGTDPPLQRSGIGSALLRSRLSRCDRAGLPAYLESSRAENLHFYERHGFAVTRQMTIPGGGPAIWLMWREPQAAGVGQ